MENVNNIVNGRNIKVRYVLKLLRRIIFGRTIPQIFFRVYLIIIFLGTILLFCEFTHVNTYWVDTLHGDPWRIPNTNWDPLLPNLNTHQYTFWNALFIACSAFSNTGLTTVNISEFYNISGQIIIFFLIWFGGIGIISIFFLVWNLFKSNDSVKINQVILLQAERGSNKLSNTVKSIRFSFLFIICTQILFGMIMTIWLYSYPSYVQKINLLDPNVLSYDTTTTTSAYHNFYDALWQGFFCSISAVSNAGFDVFGQNISLSAFRNDWNVFFQLFIMIEILVGGIGYPLIFDLYEKIQAKRHNLKHNLSLFTKVCLVWYFVILFFGLFSSLLFECCGKDISILSNTTIMSSSNYHGEWGKAEWFNKSWAILFNTVTTRSAGFSTVPQGIFTQGSMIVYCILMFIGGSPSSTAGGIRVTTLAVLFTALWSQIRGKTTISIFKRSIPDKTVKNAFVVFFISICLLLISTVIIFYTHDIETNNFISDLSIVNHQFIGVFYEVTSAFGTVGLSIGITAICGPLALIVLIIVMFIGQLSVSSFLLLFTNPKNITQRATNSYEDIKIG